MNAIVERGTASPELSPWQPGSFASLPAAWAAWVERLMVENRWPLSGNVDQWISTWAEAVSQVGFFNFNVAGSGNPSLEKRIGAQYSYGRQLGRMLDVLVPLVKANEAALRREAGDKAVDQFEEMAGTIAAMKRRGAEDIVDEVKGWRGADGFEARLADLIGRLQALQAP
jgi:hypothetical protein